MCNDYEQNVSWSQYRAAMRAADIAIAERQSGLDLPQTDDVRIRDIGPVARQAGNLVELAPMRCGAKPSRWTDLQFSVRRRHFANSNRYLVIASGSTASILHNKGYPISSARTPINRLGNKGFLGRFGAAHNTAIKWVQKLLNLMKPECVDRKLTSNQQTDAYLLRPRKSVRKNRAYWLIMLRAACNSAWK